jgi:mRNA interferase MazF
MTASAIRRGEIWWVDFDPTRGGEIRKTEAGRRDNRGRSQPRAADRSCRSPHDRPPRATAIIVATPSAGTNSVAFCDQIRAVDKHRLSQSRGRLSAEDLRFVKDGLRRVLEL